MFSTIKSRLILLITSIMAVTGSAVMFFTHQDVGTAMREAEESSAQNVLELIELNIRGEYNRLISDKIEILGRMKSELEQMTRVVGAVSRNYYDLGDAGTVSYNEAKALTLRWIRSPRNRRPSSGWVTGMMPQTTAALTALVVARPAMISNVTRPGSSTPISRGRGLVSR